MIQRLQSFLRAHFLALMDSLAQLSRAPFATIMTVGVIGIALALPMGLFIFLKNIEQLQPSWNKSAEINVFLKKEVSQMQANELFHQLKSNDSFADIREITPEQGLQEFEKFSAMGNELESLKENPLPTVFVITPSMDVTDAKLDHVVNELKQFPEIDFVQADTSWVKRLQAIMIFAERLIEMLTFVFGTAVFLIIGNTIRLATQNHESEIEVVKLVGATDAFVRRPFLYSGFFYGYCGGILAWVLIQLGLFLMDSPLSTLAGLYGNHFNLEGISAHQVCLLLLSSTSLGLLASMVAVARHLRKIQPH